MVHYGHYVFRTPAPLARFDPGLDAVTGQSIFLEGHRQNTAMFAASGASADLVELDAGHPALQARQDDAWLDSWVFAARNGALRSVWRHGRQCVAEGRHLQREAITTAFTAALRGVLG